MASTRLGRRLMASVLVAGLLSSPAQVGAHALAPAGLVVETVGGHASDATALDVTLRTPSTRPAGAGAELAPRVPEGCAWVAPPTKTREGTAIVTRGRWRCDGPLAGRALGVEGLSRTDDLVLVAAKDAAGAWHRGTLRLGSPALRVEAAPSPWVTLRAYVGVGVGHLVFGLDHVLLVLGLLALLGLRRRLVVALTMFTVGHSVTLALAALDVVTLPGRLVEPAIAVTLLLMAVDLRRRYRAAAVGAGPQPAGSELTPSALERRPGLAAAAIGLVHGLGFAGALGELGLPSDAAPLALAGFNLGLELGQLAVVAVVGGVAWAVARASGPREAAGRRRLASTAALGTAHALGVLASYWLVERLVGG